MATLSLDEAKEINKKLKEKIKQRRFSTGAGQFHTGSGLDAYASLPVSEKALGGQQGKEAGISSGYRTRPLATGVFDAAEAYRLEASQGEVVVSKTSSRRRASGGDGQRKSGHKTKPKAQSSTASEAESDSNKTASSIEPESTSPSKKRSGSKLTPNERFTVWVLDNKASVLKSLTKADKRASGLLGRERIIKCLETSGAPLDPPSQDQDSAEQQHEQDENPRDLVPEGDDIDYAGLVNKLRLQGLKVRNRLRGAQTTSKLAASPPVKLPPLGAATGSPTTKKQTKAQAQADEESNTTKASAPSQQRKKAAAARRVSGELSHAEIQLLRDAIKSTRQEAEKSRAEEEYQQTLTQLEKVKFHEVRSPHARKHLQNAYLTYGHSKSSVRKAFKQADQKAA